MADTAPRNGASSRWLALALCGIGAAIVGVSGFSSDSNHPTYLPPALNYLDSAYLAGDWWLNASQHYHFAFFALAAVLAKAGILEPGLAALNILVVATALHACFLMIRELRFPSPLAAFAIFIAIFLVSRTFASVGASYLFSPSVQPSSLAAAATLGAVSALLRNKLAACGIWLAVAGLFHVNFLVVNIPFVATAYLLVVAQERPPLHEGAVRVSKGLLFLIGPSLLLLAIFAPLLIGAGAEALPPPQEAAADWIFFGFAVPFHYTPLTYLDTFLPFLGWQLVGLLWTGWAVEDPAKRRVALAIQIALFLVIWAATALTTIVFVPAVSRLFLWRLAPFAVLFSALLTIGGALRALRTEDKPCPEMKDWIILLISFLLLPTLLSPPTQVAGQIVSTGNVWPAAALLAVLFLAVAVRWSFDVSLNAGPLLKGSALAALLLAAFATQPSDGKRSRYSLLADTQDMADERDLFAFVRTSTPENAQFLTPPELDYFRLEAERAIVVDLKAMPINRSGVIEWYRRLGRISGNDHLRSYQDVIAGFRALNPERAEHLRKGYGLSHLVIRSDQTLEVRRWKEIFRNRSYRVLAYQTDDESL